jgi:hypothetical protein
MLQQFADWYTNRQTASTLEPIIIGSNVEALGFCLTVYLPQNANARLNS